MPRRVEAEGQGQANQKKKSKEQLEQRAEEAGQRPPGPAPMTFESVEAEAEKEKDWCSGLTPEKSEAERAGGRNLLTQAGAALYLERKASRWKVAVRHEKSRRDRAAIQQIESSSGSCSIRSSATTSAKKIGTRLDRLAAYRGRYWQLGVGGFPPRTRGRIYGPEARGRRRSP